MNLHSFVIRRSLFSIQYPSTTKDRRKITNVNLHMKRLPPPTPSQIIDTGMALTLLMLLGGIFSEQDIFYQIAIGLLLVNMIVPRLYRPIARGWFALAQWLSSISSRVVLALLFVGLVVPVGWWRRQRGKDPLHLRSFKRGSSSVMSIRDQWIQSSDLHKPY